MSLRSIIPFLIAVFLVAVVGTLLTKQFMEQQPNTADPRVQLVTVEVVITATTDPEATEAVRIITATPDRTQVAVPEDIIPETTQVASASSASTNEPEIEGTPLGDGESASASLPGAGDCLVHEIAEGDTPFALAEQYDVNPFLLLEVNDLTEETSTQLQIGDQLIIPVEGCEAVPLQETEAPADAQGDAQTANATAEATAEATEEILPTPTITLEPTATDAQVEIFAVEAAGDVTAEGVRLRNTGRLVDITGWTLSDLDGTEFTFPEQFMFSESELTVYTRSGSDTPFARYWGLDEPVWQVGDIVTLRDASGQVQATRRIAPADGTSQ